MGSTVPVIDIVIIGGGISGLALAAGLCKKPHLSVHVYEAAPGYKDMGAGLALHKNAIGAMSLIGPEVLKAYFDNASNIGEDDVEMVTEVILAHGPHAGELVAELGRAKGRKSISRADLLHGLVQLIPKDKITLGKKLVHMQERIPDIGKVKNQLLFQDGSTAETDCVIGADGIHSVVRSYLLGPSHPATRPKNHDRWQVYRTLIPTQEAITKHGIDPRYTNIVSIMTGPKGHVNIVPLKKGTILSAGVAVRGISTPSSSSTFTSVSSAMTETSKLDPSLYESYHPIAQPIIKMIASPSTPNTATWSVGDHDHAPFYMQRQIAMIGDAAHASLPFAGNGAAQALEDAAVLDHLFDRVTQVHQIQAALLAYETVRMKRSQDVGDMARKFGRVYAHCGDDELEGAGQGLWRDESGKSSRTPPLVQDPKRLRKFFAEASAFTNDFDLVKQNQEAVEEFERLCRKYSR
ncbi:hypothetical protein V8F33_003491 [Rhypophila sp. PSN 637]